MRIDDNPLYNWEPASKHKPKDMGVWEYATNYLDDDLSAGVGQFLGNAADMLERAMRPDNYDPVEWKQHQTGALKAVLDELRGGSNYWQSNLDTPELEDGSIPYYLRQVARSAPETAATMIASLPLGAGAGALIKGVGGAALSKVAPKILSSSAARDALFNLDKLYQSKGIGGKVARTFLPKDAKTFASAEIGAGLEANSEYQQAINEYIADAQANGTYVPGQTELEAEEKLSGVFGKNFGWISAMNVPSYNMLLGRGKLASGLLPMAGRIGAGSLAEGAEEIGQEIISAFEQGKPLEYRNLRDAGVTGFLMGGGMHTVGEAANYRANRANEQAEARKRELTKAYSNILGGSQSGEYASGAVYGDFRKKVNDAVASNEDISRLSYNDALRESQESQRMPRLREWAHKNTAGQMDDETYNLIVQAANKYGVPVEHALAQAFAESKGIRDAKSSAGAIGIMQLMPSTADWLGVDPYDLAQNIDGGVRYLKQQYDATGDWDLAHAAYNAGLGAVQKYGGVPNYSETKNYVAEINNYINQAPQGQTSEKGETADSYRGENGKGEGKYWIRQGGHVSFEGAQPDLLNAVDVLAKYYYDNTGKRLVVTAGTNGDHPSNGTAHGHDAGFKVDVNDYGGGEVGANEDGPITTASYGKGYFADQFIKYGRSLGLGMNWEGEGTDNVHIDVALDGTQWDGNGEHAGGFNPSAGIQSRADALYSERKKSVPSWQEYLKQRQEETTEGKEKEDKPFDIFGQDKLTQTILEQFAERRFAKAVYDKDQDAISFFDGMFEDVDGKSVFQATNKNRAMLLDRYGDEFKTFAQNELKTQKLAKQHDTSTAQSATQPVTPETAAPQTSTQTSTQANTQPSTPQNRNAAIRQTANNFLESLRAKNNPTEQERVTGIQLSGALRQNNLAEVENILKQNNVAIPESTTQQQTAQSSQQQSNPVDNNTAPQNVLSQPNNQQQTAQTKPLGKRTLRFATTNIKTGKHATPLSTRRDIGSAIDEVATRAGIQIPADDRIALLKGDIPAIVKYQNSLKQQGAFSPNTAPQQTQNGDTVVESKSDTGVVTFTPPAKVTPPEKPEGQLTLKERAKANTEEIRRTTAIKTGEAQRRNHETARRYFNGEVDEEAETEDTIPDSVPEETEDLEDDELVDETDISYIQTQQQAADEAQRQWEAKRDKEAQELEARKTEAKRLSDETRKYNEQQAQQREIQSQANTIHELLNTPQNDTATQRMVEQSLTSPSESKSERIKQGQALTDLLQRPELKYNLEDSSVITKLVPSLKVGGKPAILKAQELLKSLNVDTAQSPQVTETIRTPKTQEQIAQEQRQRKQRKAQGQYERKVAKEQTAEEDALNDEIMFEDEITEDKFNYAEDLDALFGKEESEQSDNEITATDNKKTRTVNRNLTMALKEPTENKQSNKRIGSAILSLVRTSPDLNSAQAAINREAGLATALKAGSKDAIIKAQGVLDSATLSRTARQKSKKPQETKSQNTEKSESENEKDRQAIKDLVEESRKDLYEILGAEIYPELKEEIDVWANRQLNETSVQEVQKEIDQKEQDVRDFLINHTPAKEAVAHLYNKNRISAGHTVAKRAYDILTRAEEGKISFDEAYNRIGKLFYGDQFKPVVKTKFSEYLHAANEGTRDDGLKAISKAPVGTKIKPRYYLGHDKGAEYVISERAGRKMISYGDGSFRPVVLSPANIRRFFGNTMDFELIYPEGHNVEAQHSIEGSIKKLDTSTDNVVEDKDLTTQQKLLKSFGEKLGTKVVFFKNPNGNFHGVRKDGVTYINVNSNKSLPKVFWHETMHWLTHNNPELYKQLVKAAGITDEQRKAYLKETGRDDLDTNAAIEEEILADQMEDVAKRTGLLQNIAGKDRSLIERVVQWLKDTMNKFIDHFRNPQGKLTTAQAQALSKEFGRLVNSFVDKNGNQIFRYNFKTRNAEVQSSAKQRTFSSERTSKSDEPVKYSISNNNSNESFGQKIKNYVSSFKPTPRRKKRITENLRKLSNMRILYGYLNRGDSDVVVNNLQKLIQSRQAYDWEKLMPVVGKEIAKNLKLNATDEQSNYIADWLMTGALNNQQTAEAQAFQKAMRDNPDMADVLQETQELFQAVAKENIGDTLIDLQQKSFWKKLGVFKGDFTEQVFDDLSPLQKYVDAAIKKAPPALAEIIRRNVNVKQLAQLARGKGAIADLMINGKAENIEELRAALTAEYPGVYFTNFKPLAMIIDSVGGDWHGLQEFAVAKLTKEMYEYNQADPTREQLIPYSPEAKADATIKAGEAKFGAAQQDLVRFSKILAAMQYDSGLLTNATYARLMKGWKNYVPTAQVFDENEDYTKLDYLKAKKGHLGDTWSPIQIMMVNTHKIIQKCEQNKVKLQLVDIVRFGGFDSNLSEVASSNPNADNIIYFKENGKTKYLETPDASIKRALESLQQKSDGTWITKILRATTGFLRAAMTASNLDFIAGNPFRDLPDAFIHNQHIDRTVGLRQMADALRIGAKSAWSIITGKNAPKELIEWQMHGGAQASFVSGDVDYIQRSIDDATIGRLNKFKTKNPFKFLSATLDEFQRLAEASETLTRVATYTLAKNQLAKRNSDGKATINDKQLATLAAREASIDFSKAGRSTRKVNSVVLFANAAVQGINQWVEAGKEYRKGNTKPLFGKIFRAMTMAFIPSLLQAMGYALGDDDDKKAYREAPAWEKETYWILPSIGTDNYKLRIPKGFDFVMRIFGNAMDEAGMAIFADKSPEYKRLLEPVKTALPSITATIFTPTIEAYVNYSIFRDEPIVPLREQHLAAGDQYGWDSSGVAKLFGSWLDVSPRKIDYMINGYLGFMGRYTSNPSLDLDKFPMLRRFAFTPYKNPQIVKKYYEELDRQTKLEASYKERRKNGKSTESLDDYDPKLLKRLKAAQETMRKISKQERQLMADEKIGSEKRREKLRELEKRRVALCERIFGRAQ